MAHAEPSPPPVENTAIEFFAGMGLVRRALETTSAMTDGPGVVWRTLLANDFDPLKERLYRASFPEDHDVLVAGDVAALHADDLPRADLWTASFPCTDLSLAGRGAGIHAGQSGAVWSMLHLLERLPESERPAHIFFENVLGLLTSHGGDDFKSLVNAVSNLGYGLDAICVDAIHFVPQSRPRLFILAERLDRSSRQAVDPEHATVSIARPRKLIDAMRRNENIDWLLRGIPAFPERALALEGVIDDPPDDSARWWSEERCEYFRNQAHPGHAGSLERMINGASTTYATAFRRVRALPETGSERTESRKKSVAELRTDGVAGCLRTPKGGSAKQILVRAGQGELRVRHMTPVECARLQGVETLPGGFTDNELLFGLGDAVCVPAVRWALDRLVESEDQATVHSRQQCLFTTPV